MNILKMKIFTDISKISTEMSTDISEISMEIMEILTKLWRNLQRNFDGNMEEISEKLRKYRRKLWKFYPFFFWAKRYFHYMKKTKFPRNFVDNFDFFILDWIQSKKHLFEYMEIRKSKKVSLVAYKLKAGANDAKIDNFHEISWKFRFLQEGEIFFGPQKKRAKFP